MTIVGFADSDQYKVGSQFCFLKVSDVKKHLRGVHNVDTRGIDGNSLYQRFKIRATDGLLQRWLVATEGNAKQGDMMVYWNQGSNQLFLQLLELMKRARRYEELAGDDNLPQDRKEIIDDFFSEGDAFFGEFSNEAPKRWRAIAAPFQKCADNMKDFIAGDYDDIEEEDNLLSHAEFARELALRDDESDPNDFVQKIKRKYAEDDEDLGSDDRSGSSSEEEVLEVEGLDEQEEEVKDEEKKKDDDDDVDDPANHDGAYSEVEEESDDWVTSKLTHPRNKSTPLSSPAKSHRAETGSSTKSPRIVKKLTRRKSNGTSTPRQPTQPVVRRTPALRDSSDDDDA